MARASFKSLNGTWRLNDGCSQKEVITIIEQTLKFHPYQKGQEIIISELVWEVFEEFEAPEYSNEGINTFKEFINPEFLRERIDKEDFKVYCCFNEGQIVGVLALRDRTHISLLFVKKSQHRKGIAKELLGIAIEDIRRSNSQIVELTVNSSPFAIKIYEKLGFVVIDTMQEKDGIKYTPMMKSL